MMKHDYIFFFCSLDINLFNFEQKYDDYMSNFSKIYSHKYLFLYIYYILYKIY
jgi:hypothetical protein